MATLKLDIEDEGDREFLGIRSNWPEHKLVWSLNQTLSVKLARQKDFILKSQAQEEASLLFNSESISEFSVFHYEAEFERLILVANIGQGLALYDNGTTFDFLLSYESNQMSLKECARIIAQEPGVLAVTILECESSDLAAKPFNEFD